MRFIRWLHRRASAVAAGKAATRPVAFEVAGKTVGILGLQPELRHCGQRPVATGCGPGIRLGRIGNQDPGFRKGRVRHGGLRGWGASDMPKNAQENGRRRSEEHTSELQSLMRISYAVFCLKKKKTQYSTTTENNKTKLNNTERNDKTNN